MTYSCSMNCQELGVARLTTRSSDRADTTRTCWPGGEMRSFRNSAKNAKRRSPTEMDRE